MSQPKSEILAGTLDLVVLKLLQRGPANGYDITQRIQVVSRDTLSVNYGSLYPALHRLEARGWISSKWAVSENNRRAKYYSLTPRGRKQLTTEHEAWARYASAMHLLLTER